ncbi:MAG: hypothetical protein GY940_00435, partial [bacterium]|nr:hypothetical protein [bacterium]
VTYSKKQFDRGTMEQWWKQYHSTLSRVISYCSARNKREKTPGDFTYSRFSLQDLDGLQNRCGEEIQDIYELTAMQEGMLFHSLYGLHAATDFVQISYRLQGSLEIPLVEESINELLKRHDILRTVFVHEGFDRPLQVILPGRNADFYYRDISGPDGPPNKEAFIEEYKETDRKRSFHLDRDVLLRTVVFQLEPGC